MSNLTEQDICIGSLGEQKVYLNWSDVKDICTEGVSEAYEQTKRENAQLKELLKECQYMILAYSINHDTFTKEKVRDIITKIDNAIGENK